MQNLRYRYVFSIELSIIPDQKPEDKVCFLFLDMYFFKLGFKAPNALRSEDLLTGLRNGKYNIELGWDRVRY